MHCNGRWFDIPLLAIEFDLIDSVWKELAALREELECKQAVDIIQDSKRLVLEIEYSSWEESVVAIINFGNKWAEFFVGCRRNAVFPLLMQVEERSAVSRDRSEAEEQLLAEELFATKVTSWWMTSPH